jgi:hypothetical protein
MTTVRVARAEARPGGLSDGRIVIQGFLVVLADDTGRRALPLWLRGEPGANSLRDLLDRPPGDTTTAEAPEDLAARLLRAAGARVTGVDIDPSDGGLDVEASATGVITEGSATGVADVTGASARLLLPEATTTRVGISGRSGVRYAPARMGLALALALVSDAPVHVADSLMERFAVPFEDGDLLAPFLDVIPPPDPRLVARKPAPFAVAGRRPRFEPRNMAFADGLDRWDLDRGTPGEAGQEAGPTAQNTDYTVATADRSATLSAAVPEPRDSAALLQTVYADDYRNTTVAFSAEVRTDAAAQQATLRIQVLRRGWIMRPGGIENRDINVSGNHGWERHEITAPVPDDADVVRFGVTLTGPGRIEFRDPDLGASRTPATSGH